jgi:hypothetical protein
MGMLLYGGYIPGLTPYILALIAIGWVCMSIYSKIKERKQRRKSKMENHQAII